MTEGTSTDEDIANQIRQGQQLPEALVRLVMGPRKDTYAQQEKGTLVPAKTARREEAVTSGWQPGV